MIFFKKNGTRILNWLAKLDSWYATLLLYHSRAFAQTVRRRLANDFD